MHLPPVPPYPTPPPGCSRAGEGVRRCTSCPRFTAARSIARAHARPRTTQSLRAICKRLNCRSSPPPQMPTAPLHVLPRGPRHPPRLHIPPLPPARHPPLSRRPFVPHLALRLCDPFAQKILLDSTPSTPTRALADPSLLLHPPLCCLLPLTHPCPC